MIEIEGKNIEIVRGDYLSLTVTAQNVDGSDYIFQPEDVLRFKVFERKNVDNVFLEKDFNIREVTTEVLIELTADEMKIGELIDKPKDYWYEIELNPDTPRTQTIVGYEKQTGPAILTLLPEGGDKK